MAATQGLSEELEDVKMLEVDVGKSYIDDKRWGQLISLNPQYKDIDLIGILFLFWLARDGEKKEKEKGEKERKRKESEKKKNVLFNFNCLFFCFQIRYGSIDWKKK